MSETPKPASITPTTFLETLSRYDAFTSSSSQVKRHATESRAASGSAGQLALDSLKDLDTWRISLPDIIAARRKEGRAHLTHNELVNLMKCKMKRGKYRPQLLPQVTSNDPSTVERITAEAFDYNKDLGWGEKPDLEKVELALGHLSKNLKGVGPATASYLLAAQMPHWIPAFSDEGFRWAFFDKNIPGVIEGTTPSTGGWQRPIKYSLKEYMVYVKEVWDISDRLIADYNHGNKRELFGAGRVEMAGWVFGKEAAGWLPQKPEQVGFQGSRLTGTKHDKPEEALHGKRKHHSDLEKKEVDRHSPEADQDNASTAPEESKPRKSKKRDTKDSVSKRKAKGKVAGLRRSSRNRKPAH
ncbi:hypothetical protein L211DRAFT_813698 [Terfezia boudieri ATCC MYA-4762]|uniref:Uncharacterized protein n=1 Tax=Terfezia boudieri ATCC MYA-4762 TaxID=1051890 RepID=A0A3N4LF47_9PEZI|nr:hypothetical protein L211DRAFT_813698 [Terfezia boudieri ATCC MYA-4762]